MPVTTDIAATYRSPRAVMRRLLDAGRREDRALAILMGGCALAFVASWPGLQRTALLDPDGPSLEMRIGGALFAWLFVAPLIFYAIAALSHLVLRTVGGKGDYFGARVALFWSFLASTPLLLLCGMVAGLIGDGAALRFAFILWLLAFGWFWIMSLREAERGTP